MSIRVVENNTEQIFVENSTLVGIKFRNFYLNQYLLPVFLDFEISFWEVSFTRYTLSPIDLEIYSNTEREIFYINI